MCDRSITTIMGISVIFLAIILNSFSVSAATKTPQPVDELRQYLLPVNTLQANFVQVTTGSKGRHYQTTKGYMQIRRPAFFRWQIKDPFSQLLVSDGKKVWIYDEELQQVTIRAVDEQTGNIPAAILSGDVQRISKEYTLKATGSAHKKTFVLTPENKSSLFNTLQLVFVDHQLNTMIMTDSLGTETTIHFSDLKKNIPIKESDFTFTPPLKADVLDETQG